MLADSWRDLLFTVKSDKMVLDLRVDDEDRLKMMNIASFESLGENVHFGAYRSVRNLGKFCLHVIRKASEVFHIHASSCLHIFLNVLSK